MNTFLLILISSFLISLGAFTGVLALSLSEKTQDKILLYLMALSAGALMGGAFLHLIPESFENSDSSSGSILVLLAFTLFFLIEKLLNWHHCHKGGRCDTHTFGYMNLIGDSVHNFIDGLVLAAAFAADTRLGVITALAIALHEVPQEIGDFGVLLYAGWEKSSALLANFLVALTVVLGGVLGFYLSGVVTNFVPSLTAFAAGGFIYVASSDLMPELRKESDLIKSLSYFSVFLLGIFLMYLLKFVG